MNAKNISAAVKTDLEYNPPKPNQQALDVAMRYVAGNPRMKAVVD